MITKVANIRHYQGNNGVEINRMTMFGNPFRIHGSCTREISIEKFRKYFEERIESSPKFKVAVLKLTGKTLLCWCHPLPCHGNVIADWLNKQEKQHARSSTTT